MPEGTPDRERHRKLARLAELQKNYAFLFYKPYKKQLQFHALGANFRERILMAGNQLGKTYSAAQEAAYHATGVYPDWWTGRRFTKPTRAWVSNRTAELTRDGPQRLLLGPITDMGTGTIPKDLIVGEPKKARGISDAIEVLYVKHASGGTSQITFKAYKDGREAWQTETLDWLWLDEEPPYAIYTEALARITATNGIIFMTFTPLLGLSQTVSRFWPTPEPHCQFVLMDITDAEHIPAARRQQEIDKYPEYEREARAHGLPMMGSGLIYPVAEEVFVEDDLAEIPSHWAKLGGLDFGWDHPTAAVKLAYDKDTDCVHVAAAYRQRKQIPIVHVAALKPWGPIPWAWPHDGYQTEKGSGEQFQAQYRKHGLNMLSEHAQFPGDRGNSVEAGITEILERMQTGRLKVYRSLSEWHEERRGYHRKTNQVGATVIVKERDDLMDATRYGIMMLRYAKANVADVPIPDKYARFTRKWNNGRTWMSR